MEAYFNVYVDHAVTGHLDKYNPKKTKAADEHDEGLLYLRPF